MSDRDSGFGSFLSGFVFGGLVGAVVALLMAPQSGEETRAQIKDKSIEIKDKTVASLEDAASVAKEKATEFSQVAKDKTDELKQKGQVILEEQKAKLTEAVESKKKKVEKKVELESTEKDKKA